MNLASGSIKASERPGVHLCTLQPRWHLCRLKLTCWGERGLPPLGSLRSVFWGIFFFFESSPTSLLLLVSFTGNSGIKGGLNTGCMALRRLGDPLVLSLLTCKVGVLALVQRAAKRVRWLYSVAGIKPASGPESLKVVPSVGCS